MHSLRYQVFRELLISARQTAAITQQELAKRLGKPQSFVSKYERGARRLDVTEFVEIAVALGINATAFLDDYQQLIKKSLYNPYQT